MNLTCFYCQTPFTLSTDVKIAALRKMHAENLHHYDAHCPKCGRANAVSRERLEMFTPGWEEAIKAPTMEQAGPAKPATSSMPAPSMPSSSAPMMGRDQPMSSTPAPVMKTVPASVGPTRRRHATAAKKAARKAVAKRKPTAKKAAPKRKTIAKARKKTAVKAKKAASKTKARKPARKAKKR